MRTNSPGQGQEDSEDESTPPSSALATSVGAVTGILRQKGTISSRGSTAKKNDEKQRIDVAMEKLADLVGTTDGKELVDKFFSDQKLELSLQKTVKYHEQKVAQLKMEAQVLQNELEELQFAGNEGEEEDIIGGELAKVGEQNSVTSITSGTTVVAKSVVTNEEKNDVRLMDQRVNRQEVMCGQSKRKVERQGILVHQVETGIKHLKRMLDHLDKRCPLPLLKTQSAVNLDDMYEKSVQSLMNIEERLVGVIEKITLGTNKQIGDDRKLSIAQRQSEIAEAVIMSKAHDGKLKRPKSRDHLEEIALPTPGAESAVLNSPQGIRIKIPQLTEDVFEQDMKMAIVKYDIKADMEEAAILGAEADTGAEEVNRFIMEACSTDESISQQRKANLLSSASDVNHKDMGLTICTVIAETEAKIAREKSVVGLGGGGGGGGGGKGGGEGEKKSPRSNIIVNDRKQLKKGSAKLVKKKLREQEKFLLDKIAEEKASMQ